jgi:hypothetical protein
MKNLKLCLSLFAVSCGLTLGGFAQTPAAVTAPTVPALTSDAVALRSAVDLLRADIKTEKALIIAQNITFTADEAAEFWPLYTEYNAALIQLLDTRLVMLKEYVDSHEKLTNEQATALVGKVLDWEVKRTELKRTWFKKFSEVVPATKAAKFFQIENQINAALDLLLMDAIPLIK